MKITLNYIPNIQRFLNTINACTGSVLLEISTEMYLNLKDHRNIESFLNHIGTHSNGLPILTEKEDDTILLLKSLF